MIRLKNQVVEIAREAGKAILDIYNNDADFQVENKIDDSPLTKADKAANIIICDGLNALSPHYPIISEENRQIDYEVRKDYEFCWLVDPLDGTKEFIKRNGEFTVNIALIKNHKIVLGVVYTPVVDEMYWAIKGEGAYSLKDNIEIRMYAPTFNINDKNLRVVCSRSHLNEATQSFVDNMIDPILVSKGSSLKFLIIAKGDADFYPRLAPTMEWDTGAAQIILEEAGGSIIDFSTGKAVTYNKPNLLNPYFVASGNITD